MAYEFLKKKLQTCNSVIEDAGKKLQGFPEGSLKVILVHYKNGDAYQYYKRTGTESNCCYLGKDEMKIARQLAQKEYCERVLKAAEKEKAVIERFLKASDGKALVEAYTRMNEGKRLLVEPYVLPDDEFAKRWQAKKYTGGNFSEDESSCYTKRGERVRSKSEQIIADRLFDAGIPYRYEYPLEYEGNKHIYTDFTVLNKRTRTAYRWEHFGKMDDPQYRRIFFWKVSMYAQLGFIQGVNLIFTFEDRDNPLDTRYLDRLIRKFFS